MFDSIVGHSDWAQTTRQRVTRVAQHPTTVLITGPSGTGKELIARSVHAQSSRSAQPFVPVDCAAASGNLFASQLFGHEKGAFTGATHRSLGIFRAAEGGTVFLDEMGELEPVLQSKLLRVLQERVVVPLGATDPIPIDVRIIAATNRDLEEEVAANRFRADLFFRLNVVCLRTQPLSLRPEDIQPLVENFFSRQQVRHGIPPKQVSLAALECLEHYVWPGNVRELENVLERAAIFCDGVEIQPEDLPERIWSGERHQQANDEHHHHRFNRTGAAEGFAASPPADPVYGEECAARLDAGSWPRLADVERVHLVRTLKHAGYNQSQASRLLGIHRNALRRLAERLGVSLKPTIHPVKPR